MKKFFDEKLDFKKINDTINISNKLLRLIYLFLMVAAVYVTTVLLKEWHLLTTLQNILVVLSPFFLGFLIAWLLNPIISYLETKKIRRGLSIPIIYLFIFGITYLFFIAIVPIFVNQMQELIKALPGIINWLDQSLTSVLRNMGDYVDIKSLKDGMTSQIIEIGSSISKEAPAIVINSVSSVVSVFFTVVIGLMIGFYLLLDYGSLGDTIKKFIPVKHQDEADTLLFKINSQLYDYIKGLLLVLIALFIVCALIFNLIGLKAALLLAFICMVLDVIPYVGPFIGGGVATLVGFSQSPTTGIITLIAVIIIQQIEGNVLQPVIMGKTMKLNPVVIIVSLLVFGYLFGILGMILATPIAAIIKIIFNHFDHKYNITS